jgi:hypothetical protein
MIRGSGAGDLASSVKALDPDHVIRGPLKAVIVADHEELVEVR